MALEMWLAFVAASLALLVIPGPTVTLLLATGLSQGRAAAMRMVPGVMLGDLVAMALSLAGLGALLAASATLFTIAKGLGAAYLVWLGVRMWREAPDQGAPEVKAAGGSPGAQAFLVTVLNPKSILFFVAFMPQFVSPAAPVLPQLLLMGATFVLLAGANSAAYALLAGRFARHMTLRLRRTVQRTGASFLIGAGLLALATRRG
ncbi:LysE family translocator [Geminicoccaceae bacterium 1502E]|nr:LysE family translocator [Geminicoccaceae bacterium 1502E]